MRHRLRHHLVRWSKYKYYKLLRTPGASNVVAGGFAIGMAIEFITLPTGGLAFLLIFPLVWLARVSLSSALIGFVVGKFFYLPLSPVSFYFGKSLIPADIQSFLTWFPFYVWLPKWVQHVIATEVYMLSGGLIVGIGMGFFSFFIVRKVLEMSQKRNITKKK